MRQFAGKPQPPQPAALDRSPLLGPAPHGPATPGLGSPSLSRQQPTLPLAGPEEQSSFTARTEAPATLRAPETPATHSFDFSRIPVLASGSAAQPKDRHSLPHSLRAGLESLSGLDLSGVRVHYGSFRPARLQALAYTEGREIHLGPGQERVLPHEGWHAVQQMQGRVKPTLEAAGTPINDEEHLEQEAYHMGERALHRAPQAHRVGEQKPAGPGPPHLSALPGRPVIQRAMKFEIQTTNKIFRNLGGTAALLGRKFGPSDFLVKGKSGVRLESETNGVLEFETDWFRNSSGLLLQLQEAANMTDEMNAADPVPEGRKKFPFTVPGLRKGTKEEVKAGAWKHRPGFEGSTEKILGKGEELETEIGDSSWNAGIQSSESFELEQYESFLRQHEWPDLVDPVITDAQDILDAANTTGLSAADVSRLRSFLQIIVNYIRRGQGKPGGGAQYEVWNGAFANAEGLAAKQAFVLMSRTSFSSMYRSLLTKPEKTLFKALVNDTKTGVLPKLGLTDTSPFFIKGFGMKAHHSGPTVLAWLQGIYGGKDLLSSAHTGGISNAMGKFDVAKEKKKQKGLVRFEARNSTGGVWATSKDWVSYAKKLFEEAARLRKRPSGKGETGLTILTPRTSPARFEQPRD